METIIYKPRNDMVILSVEKVDKLGNVFVPQKSAEGQKLTVKSIGPKVENLKPGDIVLVGGEIGKDVINLPGRADLLMTRQENCFIVIEYLQIPEDPVLEDYLDETL